MSHADVSGKPEWQTVYVPPAAMAAPVGKVPVYSKAPVIVQASMHPPMK